MYIPIWTLIILQQSYQNIMDNRYQCIQIEQYPWQQKTNCLFISGISSASAEGVKIESTGLIFHRNGAIIKEVKFEISNIFILFIIYFVFSGITKILHKAYSSCLNDNYNIS